MSAGARKSRDFLSLLDFPAYSEKLVHAFALKLSTLNEQKIRVNGV